MLKNLATRVHELETQIAELEECVMRLMAQEAKQDSHNLITEHALQHLAERAAVLEQPVVLENSALEDPDEYRRTIEEEFDRVGVEYDSGDTE